MIKSNFLKEKLLLAIVIELVVTRKAKTMFLIIIKILLITL